MTRAFELQLWLRANGPATMAQIEAAGFLCLAGKTRKRMIDAGAIRTFEAPTDSSEGRYARTYAMHYEATDMDYTPHRGRKKGQGLGVKLTRTPYAWTTLGALTGEPVFSTTPPDEPNVAGWKPLYLLGYAK